MVGVALRPSCGEEDEALSIWVAVHGPFLFWSVGKEVRLDDGVGGLSRLSPGV